MPMSLIAQSSVMCNKEALKFQIAVDTYRYVYRDSNRIKSLAEKWEMDTFVEWYLQRQQNQVPVPHCRDWKG